MDVKAAARVAKECVADLFEDEEITQIGLEEVEFDSEAHDWNVTIGFTRPWEHSNFLINALGDRWPARSYKVIRINDKDGHMISVKDRILRSASDA